MSSSVNVVPLNSPATASTPLALDNLPSPAILEEGCPRRARMQIDLMLLAIEALDLEGSEAILSVAQEFDLQGIVKNRVVLWRMRSTNPLRRSNQRRSLSVVEAKALVAIACHLARRLTVLIRELLLVYQQLNEKQLSVDHHFRLSDYLERFRAHFRSRMNPRRAAVVAYNSDEKLNELALKLLGQLLFCTGTAGMQRFWTSLFDGEVE
jgi:Protein of unknown function (DUF3038)